MDVVADGQWGEERDGEAARVIGAVVVGFYVALDGFDDDRALGLVTPDVEWVRAGGTVRGREAVRQVLAARPRSRVTRHLVTNVDVRVHGPAAAQARCDVLVFDKSFDGEPTLPASLAGPSAVLTVRDELVRSAEGGWQIARKRAATVFNIKP